MPALGLPRSDKIATPKSEWGTPPLLFGQLNDRVGGFDMDLAATKDNALCRAFYSKSDEAMHTYDRDGVAYHCLGDLLETPAYIPMDKPLFINPDYSRGIIDKMMERVLILSEGYGNTVVALVPFCAHGWFKKYAMAASTIEMIGRIKYVGYYTDGTRVENSPSFDSCILTFIPRNNDHILSVFKPAIY